MKCNGMRCPMQKGFEAEKCEIELECPYFTPKIEQKSADYYEGFYDAAHFVMGSVKETMKRRYPMQHHHTKVFEVNGKARESICPSCLGSIVTKENEYPTYCVLCGQKILWRD